MHSVQCGHSRVVTVAVPPPTYVQRLNQNGKGGAGQGRADRAGLINYLQQEKDKAITTRQQFYRRVEHKIVSLGEHFLS